MTGILETRGVKKQTDGQRQGEETVRERDRHKHWKRHHVRGRLLEYWTERPTNGGRASREKS